MFKIEIIFVEGSDGSLTFYLGHSMRKKSYKSFIIDMNKVIKGDS